MYLKNKFSACHMVSYLVFNIEQVNLYKDFWINSKLKYNVKIYYFVGCWLF